MKYMKYIALVLALCLLGASLAACQPAPQNNPADTTASIDGGTPPAGESNPSGDSNPTDQPTNTDTPVPDDGTVRLVFNGTTCTSSVEGACTQNGSVYTITAAGTYELSGELSDGQIRVEVPKTTTKTNEVVLVLNGFKAYSSTTAPLYVVSADEVTLELKMGTVSRFEDASVYQIGTDTKPSACIFSSDDLVIRGGGSLFVTGHYKNGIGCSNDLRIKNGTIVAKAPNNILKGGDSVTISGGNVTVSDGEDGIKTDGDKEGKGFILISENAKVTIHCSDDAIQATQSITVEATASVTGTAGDKALNCDGAINCAQGAVNIVEGGGAN